MTGEFKIMTGEFKIMTGPLDLFYCLRECTRGISIDFQTIADLL